jgi:ATP-binding cassette subfamily B multidrug efflux pump
MAFIAPPLSNVQYWVNGHILQRIPPLRVGAIWYLQVSTISAAGSLQQNQSRRARKKVLKVFHGIRGTASPGQGQPPQGLIAFYWHFVRQTKGWYAAMFAASLAVALLDTVIPLFIGRLVSLMEAADRQAALAEQWPMLAGMVVLVLFVRPLAILVDIAIRHNALIPGATSLIRWQSHWHVVRQSWPFFQNDFAGRIANRVMQTANALRESTMASIRAVWYIAVYGVTAFALMTLADWRLGLPTLAWFAGYVLFLRHFVPRLRELARESSERRSLVMARVVDSYTNILTVKLFARLADEDAYVRESVDVHQKAMKAHMGVITRFQIGLTALNAALLVGTAAIGLYLWVHGSVGAGIVATALPLAWQTANAAGWVSWEVTAIFENVGVVQEGMQSIAVPHSGTDRTDARPLEVSRGEIVFERVSFGYGRQDAAPVLSHLNMRIRPGERVGLVGRSGAGKSTLVNLVLRFHEVESGRILIDGQDIAGKPARGDRHGHAGHLAPAPLDRREHPLRAAERERRAGRRRRPQGAGARVHPVLARLERAHGIRGARRRARREALGRPAPAHRARPRDPQGRADPRAG